jgi:uncharacterized membrane protein
MARIDGEIVIERPVQVVYHYVADQRNEPAYNLRMLRSEKVTDGPIGVGTRFRATARSGRRPVDMLIEVTEYHPTTRLGSRTTMSSAVIEGTLTFHAVDGRTRMTWSWEIHPTGALRLLTPLVVLLGRRQELTIWTGLKHHLEGASSAPVRR